MTSEKTVTSLSSNNTITITPDMAMYYSGQANKYANEAKKSEENTKELMNNAENIIQNSTNLSIENILIQESNSVSAVKSEGTTQVNLAKAEVAKATTQANNAANSASQAEATLNSATTTINTEKTNAINAIKAQQTTSVNAVSTQQTNAIKAVQNQQISSVNTVKSTGQSYVNKCKAWASSPNIVESGLRSAKYYAEMAQGKSDVTYETLRASRAYEDKGALLTDEQGYAEVAKYNHSTFDKSKFTVVGTPTITDDGVASGFSSSDNVTTQQLSISGSFDIRGSFKTGNTLDPGLPFGFLGAVNNSSCIRLQPKGATGFYFYYSGSQWINNTTFIFETNTEYNYQVTYDGTNLNFYMGKLGEKLVKHTDDIKDWTPYTITGISYGYIDYNAFTGSINLPSISIKVDGKEVFNGNKIGLDIVKPDNYTVVGIPTISTDGVASGFGNSNYIQINQQTIDTTKTWKVRIRFCTPTNQQEYSKGIFQLMGGDASWNYLSFTTASKLYFGGKDINGTTFNFMTSNALEFNTIYDCVVGWDGTKYYIKYKKTTDDIYIESFTNKSVPLETSTSTKRIKIGLIFGYSDARAAWVGSIDLNAFKIYVDGNLVYQPCLKIPYNVSKTGSKIVPAYARDRVIDLYEQEGHAGYYTIDEENKNFTLPMGEIYGLIGQRSLKSSMVTENFRVDIYSDKTCLICGNVATAGTVNLPIELANDNYFVTLSASTKTATSYTTTTTGDYILIGKVV